MCYCYNVLSCYSLLQILLRGGSAHGQPWRSLAAFNGIRCNDIDTLVAQFPPCMRHLHNCLRRKHRLRHMSRVRVITFLKLMSMTVITGDVLSYIVFASVFCFLVGNV